MYTYEICFTLTSGIRSVVTVQAADNTRAKALVQAMYGGEVRQWNWSKKIA